MRQIINLWINRKIYSLLSIDRIQQTMGQSSSCHFTMLLTYTLRYSKRWCSSNVMWQKWQVQS